MQKEQQICPNVSIQKRALKLVLCPPEWKKVEVFSNFAQVQDWECIFKGFFIYSLEGKQTINLIYLFLFVILNY